MILHFDDTQLDLPVNDESYRYRAIKGEHSLTLYYSLPQHVEIPVGAWCEFQGGTYTLEKPENFKKNGTRNFEYTLVLEAPQAKLKKYKFRDTVSQKLKFSLTAQPKEHLKMLVDNLNQREQGWLVGECIEAVEKVISYNHAFCMDALSQIAEEFETEYEITGKTIHLRKAEHNKDNPLPLSYGRGNGFRPGLGRSNYDNSKPVEILFVQGGERNIDASKYGSPELLLPKNQTLEYEGRAYVSDANGFSIRRADKELKSHEEDSLDCSHVYPSRVGSVTSVEVIDEEKHFFDFIDNTIPANLDFEQCLIDGETMTVIFQSGILTGREFEVKYKHAERRFEIVPQELDGRMMPDAVFKPKTGDKYAVFGMMMPNAYICDNETKTGASWDMFREAAKYLYENEEQKFSFTGELDGIWAKKDWLNIGGRIVLGGYVLFSDAQFQQEGVLIRIIGIKDYINDPYKPTIELSNAPVGGSIISDLRKIGSNEVLVDDLHRDALQFTKRRFRDAQEATKMLQEALLSNFTNSISPVAVQTMQLLVGDESLQFRFVDRIPANGTDMPQNIVHEVTYSSDKVLHSLFHGRTSGVLQHMTVGITSLRKAHALAEYKYWLLPQFDSPLLAEAEKTYYLYAKCSKGDTTGAFVLSETAIGMEAVAGYYHFLVALVNSEYEGERSVVTLYGFSEILPGRITTDRIVSVDGATYFDLKQSEIGGNIKFRSADGTAQDLAAKILGLDTAGGNNASAAATAYTAAQAAAQAAAAASQAAAQSYTDAVAYTDTTKTQLQNQIDGVIESFFYHGDTDTNSGAALNKLPASAWTTNDEKEKHLNDTLTNLDTGASWRFSKNANNAYLWVEIADTATAKALADAGRAQDTADGKRRVFVDTPYAPYDIGDLWVQGAQGDIMRCKTAKGSGGAYSANDWVKASKYTDDSAIEYLTEAIKDGNTEIAGGLVLTNLLLMKNLEGIIRAGISGMDNDAVAFFAHDSNAYNVAVNYLSGNSGARPNFAVSKNGFLVANIGRIGNANIADGDLVLEGYDSSIVITNKRVQDVQFGGNTASSTQGSMDIFEEYLQQSNEISDQKSNAYETHITEGGMYNITYNVILFARLRIDDIFPSSYASYNCYIRIYIKKDNSTIQELLNVNEWGVASGREGEYSWDTDITYSNTVAANIPAGSDIVFEFTADYLLRRTTNSGNSSCKLSILQNGSAPFFVASQINKLTYLCSDGIIIARSSTSKFVVTSKNNQISIMADLPPYNSASSGELCVATDGTVKVK